MVTENADFWSKIGIFGVRNFLRELIIEEVHNIAGKETIENVDGIMHS